VPELVLADLSAEIGLGEPDREIKELLDRSVGLNLGLDFLPGALPFDPAVRMPVDPVLAADIVWFDAFIANVDRTTRNPNLLRWHGDLWLIDHGAAIYPHHRWQDPAAQGRRGFPATRDHVLLPKAGSLVDADARMSTRLDESILWSIVAGIPDAWLPPDEDIGDAAQQREAYLAYFVSRLEAPRPFIEEGERFPTARHEAVAVSNEARVSYFYAVLRLVPRVERGERFNVGVALLCRPRRFLAVRTALDEAKMAVMAPGCDPQMIRDQLAALEAVAAGDPAAGPVAALEQAERFHWITSPSSTIIQPSPVHSGLTNDPQATLDHLFAELVEPVRE
jgi:hypothetical protein